jgi:hypothetical protein
MTGNTLGKYVPVLFGSTISLYGKSLGNDLNHLKDDIQLDWATNAGIGVALPYQLPFPKYLRTFNNTPAYNMKLYHEDAAITSMTLIFNNHKRHQVINSITLSTRQVSINYYNDSGPIVEWLPLSDKYDRYWTGGIEFLGHLENGYNVIELGFDQFTGYSPLMYEFSSILGLSITEYKSDKKTASSTSMNSSAYHLRVGLSPDIYIDAGVMGSLRNDSGNGRSTYYGLQDIIHILTGVALHPNNDSNKLYLGTTVNRTLNTTLFK